MLSTAADAAAYGTYKLAKRGTDLAAAATGKLAKRGPEVPGGAGTGFSGRRGFELRNSPLQPVRNPPTTINGRSFLGHALDQMQNRGIPPSVVENAIRTGRQAADPIPGRIRHYDPINNVTVITDDGTVVTTFFGKRQKK